MLEIHRDHIVRYGGSEGIRDLRLLHSALAMPDMGSGSVYFHTSLHEMAAAYLFHIVKNHPFVDGNKRVGMLASYVFLRMNGVELVATNEAVFELVLSVAEGRTDKAAVAQFLRKHSQT